MIGQFALLQIVRPNLKCHSDLARWTNNFYTISLSVDPMTRYRLQLSERIYVEWLSVWPSKSIHEQILNYILIIWTMLFTATAIMIIIIMMMMNKQANIQVKRYICVVAMVGPIISWKSCNVMRQKDIRTKSISMLRWWIAIKTHTHTHFIPQFSFSISVL